MIPAYNDYSPGFSQSERLMPQEEMLETGRRESQLTIGLPKERPYDENRIALVPEAVNLIVENGHRVMIETGAGNRAHFQDKEYSEAGGEIVEKASDIFKADIVLKVGPVTSEEIGMMRERQTLFSSLNTMHRDREYFRQLSQRKTTAIAFELIRDASGTYPLRRSVSEVVGKAVIMIASQYLSNESYGRGVMLGGFPGIHPTEVLIIGAGTVGENAARVAIGLGAMVRVYDHSIHRLRRLQEKLQMQVFTSVIQPGLLARALETADIAIGAVHSARGKAPCLITEDMVRNMKSGSVIIDVSIDQGGCFETSRLTSHNDPVFIKHGVTHYCVPNIASGFPHTSSFILSNYFAPVLVEIGRSGGIDHFLRMNYGFSRGTYLYNGILTNSHIGELFHLPFQDIDLIMTAFRG